MGVDLNYPDPDNHYGPFEQHDKETGSPLGWTRAVYDKINQDIENNKTNPGPNIGPNGYDSSKYTPDENAAYKTLSDNGGGNDDGGTFDPSKLHINATNVGDGGDDTGGNKYGHDFDNDSDGKPNPKPTSSDDIKHDSFDPNKQYVPSESSGFTPPPGIKEYSGPNNKSGEMAVSTDAINFFMKNLATVAGNGNGVAWEAMKYVENHVDPKPGGFARAEMLRQKVMGAGSTDSGLKGDTANLLRIVHQALYEIQASLRHAVSEYENTEDFNKNFAKAMDDAWKKIDRMDNYGKTSSTSSGGGSGDGDGEKSDT
ncbi:hypothetical protein ACQPZJ_18390 [Actinoplanes sp. CA-054009]